MANVQQVRKLPIYYEPLKLITTFTRARHRILHTARWSSCTYEHPVSFRSIILSHGPRSSRGLLLCGTQTAILHVQYRVIEKDGRDL